MVPFLRFLCENRVGVSAICRRSEWSVRRRWLHREKPLPFEVDTRVPSDVLLFRYENRRFYGILNVFAISQLVFWSCTAYFTYTSSSLEEVKKAVAEEDDGSEPGAAGSPPVARRRKWWMGNEKFSRTLMAVTFATIGCAVTIAAWFFTRRSVRHLTLLRGGRHVRLTCHSPWPLADRIVEVPLEHLSCSLGRAEMGHKPISVKGRRLFFVLDRDGEFTNTKLFDITAGLKRSWAKAN